MQRSRMFSAVLALGVAIPALSTVAQAQYYPQPQTQRPVFYLGKSHVDGRTDHDDIKVGRDDRRFHAVMLKVRYAPIQFDHVVIHYGDGEAQTLPVNTF